MDEREHPRSGSYLTIERTCKLLRMTEEEVESLYAQGRLEAVKKDGERQGYSAPAPA
jgi:hypothetical protein